MVLHLSKRRVLTTLSLVGLFGLYFASALSFYDPDFGWHLTAGRYILAHGIPRHDIFSFTDPSFAWVNHEWLNDVFVAKLYGWGGYTLLAAVFAALWAAALGIASRHRSTIMWLGALATLPYAGVRTLTWSVLLLVVLWRLLQRNYYVWIPPLFLLWANLHGSFFVGLGLLTISVVLRKERPAWVCWTLAVAATFVNPYGIHLYTEVFRTLFDPLLHVIIREWQPLSFPWETWPFITGCAAVLGVYRLKRWSEPVFWLGLLALAGLSANRNLPLLVILAIGAFELAGMELNQDFEASPRGRWLTRPWLSAVLVIVPLGIWSSQLSFHRDSPFPQGAVNYLKSHPCPGNTFNTYNDGGYLIWRLGRPVYIDGRMPSWVLPNGQKALVDYSNYLENVQFRKSQNQLYDIRCAILPRQPVVSLHRLVNLPAVFAKDGWHKVYTDNNFEVWQP